MKELDDIIFALKAQRDKLAEAVGIQGEIEALAKTAIENRNGGVLFRIVGEEVAKEFSIPFSELVRKTRRQHIAFPRFVLFYVLREMTDLTLEEVGGLSGNRDHGTVMHGCRRVTELIGLEPKLKQQVDRVKLECGKRLYTAS